MSKMKKNLFYLIIFNFFLITFVECDGNFLGECAPCHCKWGSGKKFANCKDLNLTALPLNISTEIQVIDLANNQIAELRKEEFLSVKLNNLHRLLMKNCTLQEIHRLALSGLTILIELDFSNNLLEVLEPGTFANLTKLRSVRLNDNKIKVLENELFVKLDFLTKIEIKNNQLHIIHTNVFVNLKALTSIELDTNNLTVLRKETFLNLDKLTSLSLLQNPWHCTCKLRQFRDYIIEKNLYIHPTNCEAPEAVRGQPWRDVPTESFSCPPKIVEPATASFQITAMEENISMECQATGWPKPDLSWLYEKRSLPNDGRIKISENENSDDLFSTELTISRVRPADKGSYTCVARSKSGKDEIEILLRVQPITAAGTTGAPEESETGLMLILIIGVAIFAIILLIIIIFLWCCCCRRPRKYTKNGSISENGLVSSKKDKSQNDSLLEGGSVIMEMQKGLLTDVNPVEKPPRSSLSDSAVRIENVNGHEMKQTLLPEETVFGSHDEETQSVTLSDTTPRSRQTFVDDGYGTNLPPDLLSFSARFPQSPSLQSSMSNIQDGRLFVKSPVSSPVYNNPGIQIISPGFRTLQHPKSGRPMQLHAITPAPIMYPPVLLKQGYVTIPRKPRIPSWTPSVSTNLSEYPPTSPTSMISGEIVEPVYDNLGLRTTAAGNSALNINKLGLNQTNKMRDRPLPATPGSMVVLQEQLTPEHLAAEELDSIFGRTNGTPVINANGEKATKTPPRPPPKPKKRMSTASNGDIVAQSNSTNQLFEDEGEDGTEV